MPKDDHDLLIELKVQVSNIRGDIKDLKEDTVHRVVLLEQSKLDRVEANRLQTEALTVHSDHEGRLRFLERYVWAAMTAISVITFLLSYFHPFINCCTQ